MNRFTELVKEMEEAAESLGNLLPDLDALDSDGEGSEPDSQFRLPYSSDPQPVEKRWK